MSAKKRGTAVEIPYEEACRNYGGGFSLAVLMASVICAWPVMLGWVSDPFYVRLFSGFYYAFAIAGFGFYGWATYFPVHFYETMENKS